MEAVLLKDTPPLLTVCSCLEAAYLSPGFPMIDHLSGRSASGEIDPLTTPHSCGIVICRCAKTRTRAQKHKHTPTQGTKKKDDRLQS